MKKIILFTFFVLILAISSIVTNAATFTVTRDDDRNEICASASDCSLREAVAAAYASADNDIISFDPRITRVTLSDEIVIENSGSLQIAGTGADKLTIDGGAGTNRIFYINEAVVRISGVTLTGGGGTGRVSRNAGGAIYASAGAVTLDRVHVRGNSTIPNSGRGGGVEFTKGANFTLSGTHHIENSTFSGNSAGRGGGFNNAGCTVTVTNSTISGNQAIRTLTGEIGGYGGGLSGSGDAVTTLRNVTVTGNTALVGGGTYQQASQSGGIVTTTIAKLNFGNTIIAGNSVETDGFYSEIWNELASVTSAGGNFIGDSAGESLNTETAIEYHPTDIFNTNPMLAPLALNGGTVPTHAPLAGSPLIDAGVNELTTEPFDQRGAPRIVDGNRDGTAIVDIGAVEFQPIPLRRRRPQNGRVLSSLFD